jgi:hypothetical protein
MKIIYLANVRLPTEKAHGIQITKACESLGRVGVDIELVVPRRYTPIEESPERYYAITTPFPKRRLAVPDVVRCFGRFGFMLQTFFFGIASAWYAVGKSEYLLPRNASLDIPRSLRLRHDNHLSGRARDIPSGEVPRTIVRLPYHAAHPEQKRDA